MKIFVATIFCCLFALNIYAEENCIALKANKTDGSAASQGEYVFKQHTFSAQNNNETKQDLVIVEPQSNSPGKIRRVTFGRGVTADGSDASKTCYFKPLAFIQGGEREKFWGWHILWTEPTGLYYARMDGEAWVSSNPKRLTTLAPIMPQFKLEGQNIAVSWVQVESGVKVNMQAVSDDEGRNWVVSTIQP
jgi:hypothetical protein